ncbi:ABC transporter ATP-binding protein [Paenibacillus doosanensis]|uniref:Iron(3+)-hydroxamate import ATP-binding protein FhuC n=1 Tax=Paenibacillus konkukensis TaxID=2020716 RepID=A0ABY4RX10_9BACL|nr:MULTISPECIES: ABC transporter ATP-binding protein [Paenibacillus]MCS7460807.1 ABC transporter ATP-binding protein [Paenibacillus doosanensis]UQZ85987.1 Iron(3+)-hydroxamate import ATP-binding protein FhuC [Paenibacillus konkukensis]
METGARQELIRVQHAAIAYHERPVLEDISFAVHTGECFGVIGPNGSGKSTLLKLISGVEKPGAGSVLLQGQEAHTYPRKPLARWTAVLQQDALPALGFTVREIIAMGRYPFQNWLGDEAAGDDSERLIDAVIERLELAHLQHRSLDALSGGERQRVALGKVMAQQPKLLLLDEPTTYLDIGYQVQMMEWIRSWQQESGLTVVAVLHELNLAAQYCDRLLLLQEGRAAGIGRPEEVIRSELLEQVYRTQPIVLKHPVTGAPQILLQGGRMRERE